MITHNYPTKITITPEQLLQFDIDYFGKKMDKHLRYGQAFANEFNLTDSTLFYMAGSNKHIERENCYNYIIEHYLEKP